MKAGTYASIFAAAVSLTGCVPAETAPPPKQAPIAFRCDPSGFSSFVGKNESVLAAATFPQGIVLRIIKPGQPVTMDYSDARVNFLLDAKGVITQVTCG